MSFNRIDHPGIQTHSHVVGEHLAEGPFRTLHFLLVLDVIDSTLREGAHLHVPHVVMTYCSIHPLFHQDAKAPQLIPRDLRTTRPPSQTTAEVITCPNREDTDHNRRQVHSRLEQL